MPRPKIPGTRRIHLVLNTADLSKLETYFGQTIGVSESIRIAITKLLREHESLARPIIDTPQPAAQPTEGRSTEEIL